MPASASLVLIKRRWLTFIEMIVVIAILLIVAGAIGINIRKSTQEQRFRTEVALIMDKLRAAQNLMLILNEDVKLQFHKVGNGIYCGLTFDCTLPKGWGRELTRPQLLTAIREVSFRSSREERSKENFALDFLSGGMVMSRGILKLSTGRSGIYSSQRYICLPGNPAPLMAVEGKLNLACLSSTRANDQLTQLIMPEIIAKIQAASNKEARHGEADREETEAPEAAKPKDLTP